MPDCGVHCLWFALGCFVIRSPPPPPRNRADNIRSGHHQATAEGGWVGGQKKVLCTYNRPQIPGPFPKFQFLPEENV